MTSVQLMGVQFKSQFYVGGELVRNVDEALYFPELAMLEFRINGKPFVKPWADVDFATRIIPLTSEAKAFVAETKRKKV